MEKMEIRKQFSGCLVRLFIELRMSAYFAEGMHSASVAFPTQGLNRTLGHVMQMIQGVETHVAMPALWEEPCEREPIMSFCTVIYALEHIILRDGLTCFDFEVVEFLPDSAPSALDQA